MEWSVWLLYTLAASLNIISPGPAMLLAVTNSVLYGVRGVIMSSLGYMLGLLILASVAIIGVTAAFKTHPWMFTALKLFGAAYLIFLGIRQAQSTRNVFQALRCHRSSTSPVQSMHRRLFAGGFIMAITNPKPTLFFAALYPQFMNNHEPLAPQFVIMTATFITLWFMSSMSYAWLTSTAKNWFAQGQRAVWFNRASGAAFIILGLSLLMLKDH